MDAIDQIDLRTLRLFALAAHHGSFAEAGRKSRMPRTLASKLIGDLEVTLGGKLFRRTTRKVALTDLGRELLARILPSLTDLQTGLEQTRSYATETAGAVRLSASHAFGRRFIVPTLQTFMARHPEIRVELLLHDDLDDLIARTLDFTIRLGPLPQSSIISRRLGSLKVVAAAERRLLERAPALSNPEDLRQLPMIGFRIPGTGTLLSWEFKRGGKTTVIDPSTSLICNSIEGIADMVREGMGAALVPHYLIEEDLKSGRLKGVFAQHEIPSIPAHICFIDRDLMPRRVRLLINHLASSIGAQLK